jgi:kynureninase
VTGGADADPEPLCEADALAHDAADPLSAYRQRFHLPIGPDGAPAIYLAGQSLGLQPRTARAEVEAELEAWARLGVDAWFEPDRPWFTYTERLREPMARIVGARPSEVAILNALTVNIHLLLASFYRPYGRRRRILVDGPLFPSDRHALTSHLVQRGLDPARDLLVIEPRDGSAIVPTSDLEAAIREHGSELALVFLAGVNFATGQLHEVRRLTAAARESGAIVGWDLAHAAGNVELSLHDWDVDFAAWCTYKYLNGGPGSVGAIFVHDRHGQDPTTPRLGGWWGLAPERRFDIVEPFAPALGAAGWEASTPPVLALAPLAASLRIFDEVGLPALRARSIELTGFLARLLDAQAIEVITPTEPAARGAQLSLRFGDAEAILQMLAARGVAADFRAPDIIRVAPIPLYNTYHEAWRFAHVLGEAMAHTRGRHGPAG